VSELEREIARQRAALLRIEQAGANKIAAAYRPVEGRLRYNLDALTREIERARAQGFEVRPGWLFAQRQYRALIEDLHHGSVAFLQLAAAAIIAQQAAMVGRVPDNARRLATRVLGPAPREAVTAVEHRFGRTPTSALEKLVGYAGDGQPIGHLLERLAPATAQAVTDALAYGVATGKHPRVIARDVMLKGNLPRTRSLLIARTESMRAYREASLTEYRASSVVESWVWLAMLDNRCCVVCAGEDGTVHSMSETMDTHPACRCIQLPQTKSWSELGFRNVPDSGPIIPAQGERFAALPESEKLAILGKARLDAYNTGDIALPDLVRPTYSERWGNGRRPATLSELALT
jgi:SPP1 gp7 family putative phage head morphogenesis protein